MYAILKNNNNDYTIFEEVPGCGIRTGSEAALSAARQETATSETIMEASPDRTWDVECGTTVSILEAVK